MSNCKWESKGELIEVEPAERSSCRGSVDQLKKEHWSSDECEPIFIVSILYDYEMEKDKKEQYILLTIQHLGSAFSTILFPKKENIYGYDSLLDEIHNLYNQSL